MPRKSGHTGGLGRASEQRYDPLTSAATPVLEEWSLTFSMNPTLRTYRWD